MDLFLQFLSSILESVEVWFKKYAKEALDDLKEGICVGGELVQSVRYADD